MKWPSNLTLVRHGQSAYNELKALKEADPLYQEFLAAYENRRTDYDTARKLAEEFMKIGNFVLTMGEHNTPMTALGQKQSEATGAGLKHKIPLPDVVLVSPFERTGHTLDFMIKGWPELAKVKRVEEERLREQEHGLASLYNDWRIFNIMHPEQEALYDQQGPYYYRYPQGESVPDVRDRSRDVLGLLTRDYSEQNVLAVTHHLFILSHRANTERLDATGFQYLDDHEKPINCGVTKYHGDPNIGDEGKLVLDFYNAQLYDDELAA